MKTSMEQHKACVLCAIVLGLMAGCKSDQTARTATINPPVTQPTPDITPDPKPNPEPPVEWVPSTPLEPSTPIVPEPEPENPETPKPTLPIFISDGITTHTQSPYIGTVTRGGDNYLRYNSTSNANTAKTARAYNSADFQNFELPKWTVDYKYEPFLEVLITNGAETLCARYSWKKDGFGYAKPHCLWSDTRQAVPLTDMKNAYYGYSVSETRVWLNGVVGLWVVGCN